MSETAHSNRPITSYADFWPYYLQEHAKPATRALHYAGTALALGCVAGSIALGYGWLGYAALAAGYGPAWIAHFFVEKNRPATFTHPLWSLISDFRMAGLWATGKLGPELVRAGVGR
ncbi:MAG: DUF962 domain-containing protein [Proteobacteria bacterium]|nr:DUF962 domain-containing protein [Pseudomonadota bacterium]